jgi:hypothetical protein
LGILLLYREVRRMRRFLRNVRRPLVRAFRYRVIPDRIATRRRR